MAGGCGCGGGSSTGLTSSGGALLSGTLDSRFASDLGTLPTYPAETPQTQDASVAGGGFSLSSLAAFPGGKWTAFLFLAVAAYTIYAAAKKSE